MDIMKQLSIIDVNNYYTMGTERFYLMTVLSDDRDDVELP